MRGRTRLLGLLVVVATLLATVGCLPDLPWEQEEDTPDQTIQPELENTSWVLDAAGPESSLKPSIAGHKPTIDFSEGDLSGSTGCNSYFGLYTYDTNGSLDISGLGNTEMACPEPGVMEQEQLFLDTLRAAGSYRVVSGKLRIRGGGNLLVLSRPGAAPVPTPPPTEEEPEPEPEEEEEPEPEVQPELKNTDWELKAYGEPGSLTTAIPGKEPTLHFATNDMNGHGGCNSFFGSYDSDTDGSLEFSGISVTMMYCTNQGIRDQEKAYIDALELAETYRVVDDELHIEGGGRLLIFEEGEEEPEEQPPLKNTSWELVAYGEPGNLTTPISGKEPTLEFDTTDLGGNTGCNSYFGDYTSDTDGSLEVSSLSSTMMLCMGPGIMQQEHDYLEALRDADWYEIVGDELHLSGPDAILVFEES